MKKNLISIFGVCILIVIILLVQFFRIEENNSSISSELVTADVDIEQSTDELPVVIDTEIEIMDPIENELECVIIDDFSEGTSQLRWFTVNDGVMGGLSQGTAVLEQNMLVHTGVLNTNGGGFSYVGARLPADILTGYNRIQIRLNTYGRQYAVNFEDSRYMRVAHQALIPNEIPNGTENSWQEVFIDFDQTIPKIFSNRVNSKPFLAGSIDELNFILGDGINGPFRMELDWVKACL